MRDYRLAFVWFLLLPLLPACSVIPSQPQTLEGFSADVVQQVGEQADELKRLQKLDTATPDRQQQINQLQKSLGQFERDVLRIANNLELRDEWHGAEQVLQGAMRILPDSETLNAARQQLAEKRQRREERVRMELAIHEGEQLQKNADAYRQLQQLQEPGLRSWLELKNFQRKRHESGRELQRHAQRALQREDYAQAHRALMIAQRLYGSDLEQDSELRETLEQNLAQANRHLRPAKSNVPQVSPKKVSADETSGMLIAEVQQALTSGDLLGAKQQLEQLQQQSPQHPQLLPLQSQFQSQANARVATAIERGNHFYSQGKIELAVDVWHEALPLEPDNVELLGNIARAKKVLENLRYLSKPAAN